MFAPNAANILLKKQLILQDPSLSAHSAITLIHIAISLAVLWFYATMTSSHIAVFAKIEP
jgi:hypothetical protein